MELKTARLTILIDPAKKSAFEDLCRTQDMTPSQVVRRLIRDFMEQQEPPAAPVAARRAVPRKGTDGAGKAGDGARKAGNGARKPR